MRKFEVGKTYKARSLCNHDCIFSHEILGRTAKTVTINVHGEKVKRKIHADPVYNAEVISPYGKYSFSPVLKA